MSLRFTRSCARLRPARACFPGSGLQTSGAIRVRHNMAHRSDVSRPGQKGRRTCTPIP